jgi:hypothetical protein
MSPHPSKTTCEVPTIHVWWSVFYLIGRMFDVETSMQLITDATHKLVPGAPQMVPGRPDGKSGRLVYITSMNSGCCHQCHDDDPQRGNASYRRVLWIVLAVNAVMFIVEIGAGLAVGSAALQADALDFLGDAGNYAISLFVVGMALRYRAMAALAKGATMGIFGLWVLGVTGWHAWEGTLPQASAMGAVGFTALVANGASFYGAIAEVMPTCARLGFAHVMTWSAISPC